MHCNKPDAKKHGQHTSEDSFARIAFYSLYCIHRVICLDPKDLSVPLITTSTARNPTDLSSLS